MAERKRVKRNGPGRRLQDFQRLDCPYHAAHEKILEGLGADMKQKVGLKTIAILVSILLVIPGVSYLAISRYVESTTQDAVSLLRDHIERSERRLNQIHNQLQDQNSTLRVMNYRLNKLDKTPEYPRVWPGKPGAHKPKL